MEAAPFLQDPCDFDVALETHTAGCIDFMSFLDKFDIHVADIHIVCIDFIRDRSFVFQEHFSYSQVTIPNDFQATESLH